MGKVPPNHDGRSLYIAARTVLLDALEALVEQREAIVLVGAQAVYLHSGSANLSVAAFTSDADLGLDPELISDHPYIDDCMIRAGFTRDVIGRQAQPGLWFRNQLVDGIQVPIEVDLLAPETLTDGGRGAQIPPHDRRAVRRVLGIELAMEDHQSMTIVSLEPTSDVRSNSLRVAGVPALLVAKAYKIADRLASPTKSRVSDKDAADVYRLMITADPSAVASRFSQLGDSLRVGAVARSGLGLLHAQFGAARSPGVEMAVRALQRAVPADQVRAILPAFIAELPKT